MALTASDLELIRDEIGDTPDDGQLNTWYADLGNWLPVAIRALKRRRAAAGAGGGVSQVTVPGAVAVTVKGPDLAGLDEQIARLEARWAAEQGLPDPGGASSSRLCRVTPR